MNVKSGDSFIDSIYNDLINSEEVKSAIKRKGVNPKNREEAISIYMNRLEKSHSTERKIELLKSLYYKRYVIDHLPESYILTQSKMAREQGFGDIRITDEIKKEMLKQLQNDQKKSLDSWLTYLNSKDAVYPMWFKYYAFQGMLKLGKFDKEKGKFTKRSKDTVLPFIEVNPEVLGHMYTVLNNMINGDIGEEEKKALASGQSFVKLYTYIVKNKISKGYQSSSLEGVWVKYEQGDNYKKLWQSLQGKNTGWCTAGEETCKLQLRNGDFYVYYTKDENEEYNMPRIAIRMDGKNKIGEVRGISKEQNLESDMVDVADKKLDEFPDKELYQKKVHDMKLLTIIENKINNDEELTKEEIIFLYEVDSQIEGFGWDKDPRIDEIKSKRNIKKDLAHLFGCEEENIGTNPSDFNDKNIIVYVGDLVCKEKSVPENFKNLKFVTGYVSFRNIKNAKGLENLQFVGENAYFKNLISAEGLNNLQRINGGAYFENLISAEGLENLQRIGDFAVFKNLESVKGLENLQFVGGNTYFSCLITKDGLEKLR